MIYPESTHVKFHDLQSSDDFAIREFALRNSFHIVSFDADFNELSLIYGYPPKIIWLKCGNTSTKNIEKILKDNFEEIKKFLEDKRFACLELY